MTKPELVLARTQHHCAWLLKYYPRPPCAPSFVKSRVLRPLETHFLLFPQIFFILVCIHARNPSVPPRVLASGPNPCGGNNIASKVTQFQSINLVTSSARSIILWMHDAMKPLKCLSVSLQLDWIKTK